MIQGSVYIKMHSGGDKWHPDSRYVHWHWRKSLEDFVIWAVKNHPDAVSVNVSVLCCTNDCNRPPADAEFDLRDYNKEWDGPGTIIQDPMEYYWAKRDGKWMSVQQTQGCLDWYYTDHGCKDYEEFLRKNEELTPAPYLDELCSTNL